jgi:hypothetical protein
MIRLLIKARHALLTDPVTGKPLHWIEVVGLFYGLLFATATILAAIAMALGLGGGQ